MDIAEIADADVEAVVDLWRRCELTRPWNDPHRDLDLARRSGASVVLVGRIGGAPAASVMVGFDGHRGWLYYLAVAPKHRRRGFGRAMMAAAESWLRTRGAPKMQLMVRETNAGAAGFYRRLGYETQPVVTFGKRLGEGSGTAWSERVASCHCGDLELRCEGEPARVSMCHCLDCQRRTGAPFGVAVFYERGRVRVARGETRAFERPSASGFPVRFHFCPRCGANVFWEPARLPDRVGVALGAFADPGFPAPEQAVWMKDKHVWLSLPGSMTLYELNPPPRPSS